MFHETTDLPPSIDAAHQVIQTHSNFSRRELNPEELVVAAGICLHSSYAQVQADGLDVLVNIAESEVGIIVPVVRDLVVCSQTTELGTQIKMLSILKKLTGHTPTVAPDVLEVIELSLKSDEPLVQELACNILSDIARNLGTEFGSSNLNFDSISQSTRSQITRALDLLFDIVAAEESSVSSEWSTSISIDYLPTVFWGPVELGESRREYARWYAAATIAWLSPEYPALVSAHKEALFEAAVGGKRSETRWYAVDALGRAGCLATLRKLRDEAFTRLGDPAGSDEAIETLYQISFEGAPVLAERVGELAERFESVDAEAQKLVAEALVRSAGSIGASVGIEIS